MGWAHQSRVEAAAASLESATAAFVAYLDALPDAAVFNRCRAGGPHRATPLTWRSPTSSSARSTAAARCPRSPASPISPTSNGTSMLRPLASRRRRL